MKREFFKTMLLYFLVIISLFLTVNIWSGKELWSHDYSSFVYSARNFFNKKDSRVYMSKDSVQTSECYGIKWIALSSESKKSVSYLGEESYNVFSEFLSLLKSDITKAGTVSLVEHDDFINIFKGNGICAKFSTDISLVDYFKCDEAFFDDVKQPYSDIVFLSIPIDSTATKYLYFSDKKTKQNYRLPVKYTNEKLSNELSKLVKISGVSDSFSFELNFDKKIAGVERILLDSLVPVSLSEKNVRALDVQAVSYDSSGDIYDSVFRAFNIKKNSARSYTDADGVTGFIENYATLRVFKNGYFQYETDVNYEGLPLGEGDNAIKAIAFANNIYKGCVETRAFLCLEKSYEENGVTTYEFSYSTPWGSLYSTFGSCATMKVENGNIIFYKQLLLDISVSERNADVGSLLNAYDEMYNSDLPKTKSRFSIVDLYPVNVYKNDGKVEQKWCFEFSDGSYEFL